MYEICTTSLVTFFTWRRWKNVNIEMWCSEKKEKNLFLFLNKQIFISHRAVSRVLLRASDSNISLYVLLLFSRFSRSIVFISIMLFVGFYFCYIFCLASVADGSYDLVVVRFFLFLSIIRLAIWTTVTRKICVGMFSVINFSRSAHIQTPGS